MINKSISPVPSLISSPIDLISLRDKTYHQLKTIITKYSNPFAIVFDDYTISAINLTLKPQQLKQLGITSFHTLHQLDYIKNKNVIYIISPLIENCQVVSKFILQSSLKQDVNNPVLQNKNHHIIFLPKRKLSCERVFEYEGIYKYITIDELPLNIIAVDDDLLTTDDKTSFPKMMIDRDNNPLFNIKNALIKIQENFGIIPFIQGMGNKSEFIIEEMLKHFDDKEYQLSTAFLHLQQPSQIGRMIIIDRDCDYLTPLLTPFNYAGLIDEIFGIDDNIINNKNIIVNHDEPIYRLLCDENINHVGNILTEKIKLLDNAYKIKDKTNISDINKSFKNL
jgi:hypothetical protein